MHLFHSMNLLRGNPEIAYNKRAEEVVCELLRNLSRYPVVMADLEHRHRDELPKIIKAFPVLERSKMPAAVTNLEVAEQEAIKTAYRNFIGAICNSEHFKKYPSVQIIEEIIFTGFPVHELYTILVPEAREIEEYLLPGISKQEACLLENADDTDAFRDAYDYKIINTPVVYQGMKYDFSRLMQYVSACRAKNKTFTVGFARNDEVDLNLLHIDYTTIDCMRKKLKDAEPVIPIPTWRNDLINNYLLAEQQGAALEYINNIRELNITKQTLYVFGMLLTMQSMYKFIQQDMDYKYNSDVCPYRYSLDFRYILGGGILEHFRFLPMTFKMGHDFIHFLFATVDQKYSLRQWMDNLVKITVPYYYISALDRILFVPLTRSNSAWLECSDVGDGVKRDWAPYIILVPALICAHSIAFAFVKNFTYSNFDALMFSRNRLLQMFGLIVTARLQNMLQAYYEEKFVNEDSRATYSLMLLAGACIVMMFELLWTFYATPGIKFSLDLGDKLYPFSTSADEKQRAMEKSEQTKVIDTMQALQDDNHRVVFKEGLFFWRKNSVQVFPIVDNTQAQEPPELTAPRLLHT